MITSSFRYIYLAFELFSYDIFLPFYLPFSHLSFMKEPFPFVITI